ncbi:MAG: hypothetical protein P3B98_04180 [Gemmatimonadota bacterium]|nr:hypothetical protein [Gemmatimonadota bacterium]
MTTGASRPSAAGEKMKAAAFGRCFPVAGLMLLVSEARGTRMTREARQ